MDTGKLITLARDIESYKTCLKWLRDYRDQLEKPGSYEIRVSIYTAGACVGASEAKTLFESILQSKTANLLDEAARECNVGVERCEEQIREITKRS